MLHQSIPESPAFRKNPPLNCQLSGSRGVLLVRQPMLHIPGAGMSVLFQFSLDCQSVLYV